MRLQGKPIQSVTWDDLQALVDNRVPESPSLEYKESLPAHTDLGKKELLADVSSLANSLGGILLFGAKEKRDEQGDRTDTVEELVGIETPSAAEAQLWLEQVIRSGLDPPLARVEIRYFPVPGRNRYVLAIGVPASLLAPHAVAFATTIPFWRRAGSMKYPLRTHDLRQAFLERHTWDDDANAFRDRRLGLLQSGRTPVATTTVPTLMLQVVPLGRLTHWIDLVPHWDLLAKNLGLDDTLFQGRLNFEGLLRNNSINGGVTRYVQWFRFGGIEVVATDVGSAMAFGTEWRPSVDATRTSIRIVEYALQAMSLMNNVLAVGPPYGVLCALTNVQARHIETIQRLLPQFFSPTDYHQIVEDHLVFPPVLFEEVSEDVDQVAQMLRRTLDALWQAGGFARCLLYSAEGAWKGRDLLGWNSL
jgi:hypothetical protein